MNWYRKDPSIQKDLVKYGGCSSEVERSPYKALVVGSSPTIPIKSCKTCVYNSDGLVCLSCCQLSNWKAEETEATSDK
jgi:hypothetical protein